MRFPQLCLVAAFLSIGLDPAIVRADQPPILTAPPLFLASEGAPQTLVVTAADPDGDPITSLTASPLPTGATFTAGAGNTSGTFSWQPTFQQAGAYSVTFTAVNSLTAAATTAIDVAETRTQANDVCVARLWSGVSAATGELSFALPPDPVLGGPMPLAFSIYYGSLLDRTAVYASALGVNWRGTYDWRLVVAGGTAQVEDHLGALYTFVADRSGAWVLSEPTDLPHQLVAVGAELVFKHGESLHLYYFDPATGRLTAIEDLPGNRHTLTYAGSQLAEVGDAFGRRLTLTHSSAGRLTQVSDGTRTVLFGYSGNRLTSTTDSEGHATHFGYDATNPIPGLLTSIEDPTGAIPLSYSYDAAGRVMRVTNAKSAFWDLDYLSAEETRVSSSEGGQNTFTHHIPGRRRLFRHIDALGGLTEWTYDTQGRVTDVSRPGGGSVLQTTYDPTGGYPATIRYPGGDEFRFTYVARSRVPGIVWHLLETQTAPDLTRIQLEYGATGILEAITDEAMHTWRFIRNARGQTTQTTYPSGGTTSYTYDALGRLDSRTTGSSTTSYAYDALDRLVTLEHPDNSTRTFTHDARNRPLSATNELQKPWSFTYRDNGQLESVTDPLLHATTLAYDNMTWPMSETDALGHAERYGYDDIGRLTSRTDRTGRTWTYTYDLLGRLETTRDPDQNAVVRGWDPKSRLQSITAPLGRTLGFGYDLRDRLGSVTDPRGKTTSYGYDSRNHLTSLAAPLGYVETYGYDPRGLLESAQIGPVSALFEFSPLRKLARYTDGNGNDWQRSYDVHGRLMTQTDPLTRTVSFSHDPRNRLSGFTSTLGSATFTWDVASRLTRRSYSDGTVHTYTYDDVDRLLTTEGVTRTYDALGRMTQENGISFGYDDASRLSSQSYGAGLALVYDYDPRGLLARITDWHGGVTTYTYDAAGRRTGLSRPDGTTTLLEYDPGDRLVHWKVLNAVSGDSIASATIDHDDLGRVKIRFPWNSAWSPPPPLTTGAFSHDAASQISGFTYDGLGRLLQDGVRSYTWDLASRLTSFTEGGRTKSFLYDGLDRGYESTLDGVVTGLEFGPASGGQAPAPPQQRYSFTFDGNAAGGGVGNLRLGPNPASAAEHEVGHWLGMYYPSAQNGSQLYFPGKLKVNGTPMLYNVRDTKGQLLYTIGPLNGQGVHHHLDDLGNVAFLTDDLGAVRTTYAYSPTGEVRQHGWTPAAPRYTYKASGPTIEESSTGLYRIGGVLYDTRTGRALQPRFATKPPVPQPGNRLYVGNLTFDTMDTPAPDGAVLVASATGGLSPSPGFTIEPPAPQPGNRLFVGNLTYETSTDPAPMDGAILVVSAVDGPMPSPLGHVLLGRQVGSAGSDHPDFMWWPQGGPPPSTEYHKTNQYAVQVGWWERAHSGKYYVTGARHVYMPSGLGFAAGFNLGTGAPPHAVDPTKRGSR